MLKTNSTSEKGSKTWEIPNAPKISNYDDLDSTNCEFINSGRGISLYSDDVFSLCGGMERSFLKQIMQLFDSCTLNTCLN